MYPKLAGSRHGPVSPLPAADLGQNGARHESPLWTLNPRPLFEVEGEPVSREHPIGPAAMACAGFRRAGLGGDPHIRTAPRIRDRTARRSWGRPVCDFVHIQSLDSAPHHMARERRSLPGPSNRQTVGRAFFRAESANARARGREDPHSPAPARKRCLPRSDVVDLGAGARRESGDFERGFGDARLRGLHA